MSNDTLPGNERLIITPTDFVSEDFNFFANLLIENNILNKDNVKKYLTSNENSNPYDILKLTEGLLKLNFVDEEITKSIFQQLENFRARFGRVGIEMGKMTFVQVQKALRQRENTFNKSGQKIKIGTILLFNNVIKKTDLNDILDFQIEKKEEIKLISNLKIDKILSDQKINKPNIEYKDVNEKKQNTFDKKDMQEIAKLDEEINYEKNNYTVYLTDDCEDPKENIVLDLNYSEEYGENSECFQDKDYNLPESFLNEDLEKNKEVVCVLDEKINNSFTKITMCFSENKMEAQILSMKKDIKIYELKYELKEMGISFGLVKEEELKNFIKNPIFPFTVAIGNLPIKPISEKIIDKYTFLKQSKRNSIVCIEKDKKENNYFISEVPKDTIIRIKSPARKGKDGCNVFGEIVKTKVISDGSISHNKGVNNVNNIEIFTIVDKKTSIPLEVTKALICGIPCIDESGKISIKNNIIINENVFFEEKTHLFGKKTFCNVNINGIINNAIINCEELLVDKEIQKCEIIATELKTGKIINSKIAVKGSLIATKIENSELVISDKIIVNGEIINSNITSNTLKAEKVTNAKIIIKNQSLIKELFISINCEIEINKEDIIIINKKILEINKIKNILKELESVLDKERKMHKIHIQYKNQYDEVCKRNIDDENKDKIKNTIILIEKNCIKQVEKKKELLVKINKLSINTENEELLIKELNKNINKYTIDLMLLEQKFNESRLKPILKIKKLEGTVVIKGMSNKLEFSNNKFEINVYEEKEVNEDGTYTTKLVIRK